MRGAPISLNRNVLAAMGDKYMKSYARVAEACRSRIAANAEDVEALLGLADINVLLFIFGYSYRKNTIPAAEDALEKAALLEPSSPEVSRLSGILSFLRWDWEDAESLFLESIRRNPQNLDARHWYSLYLVAMGRFEEAMAVSDELTKLDVEENYLVGRGSLLYFQHRFAELKELMHRCIAKDQSVPWGYDWLGMAYNGLEAHQDAISTYSKAFELSDGTAEVGAGYGHALALAGEIEPAKQMADFYASLALKRYVPPVQRAYIHIGLGEYDEAIRLLEVAFAERSWFLAFIKVEPWLDPLRGYPGFGDILQRMNFPQ